VENEIEGGVVREVTGSYSPEFDLDPRGWSGHFVSQAVSMFYSQRTSRCFGQTYTTYCSLLLRIGTTLVFSIVLSLGVSKSLDVS
jgi:hypothetical protein